MSTLTTADSTTLFYRDWGTGQPILYSHGWPLTSDAWDAEMLFFGMEGSRVCGHDRRGHGRSGQPWTGDDMDRYADDLAELIEGPRPARRDPGWPLDRRRRGRALCRTAWCRLGCKGRPRGSRSAID